MGKNVQLLDTVESNQFEYLHRKIEDGSYTYTVTAVGADGTNGEPAVVNIE